MGADDDLDCQHDWVLQQVLADATGSRLVHECADCGAVSYEASASDVGT